jgi:hypothetical protein
VRRTGADIAALEVHPGPFSGALAEYISQRNVDFGFSGPSDMWAGDGRRR